jgi:hypothetical protein
MGLDHILCIWLPQVKMLNISLEKPITEDEGLRGEVSPFILMYLKKLRCDRTWLSKSSYLEQC